jgi:hypothetical protein
MNVPYGEIVFLKDRLKRSEARHAELSKKYEKLVERLDRIDEDSLRIGELLNERVKFLAEQQEVIMELMEDAFDRIKNVELTLFPNLASDIKHLYGILGTRPVKRRDPLDRRDPQKKPPKKT